jgi:plasmid stabilization system protein ParE
MRRLVIRPEAEADVAEAARWYEDRWQGLGTEFVEEVDRTLAAIAEDAFRYARIRASARRALTRRFPYAIFFVVQNDEATVLAVLHTSRRPGTWQRPRPSCTRSR